VIRLKSLLNVNDRQGIVDFIASLSDSEKKFYDIGKDNVLDSLVYVQCYKDNSQIVGIGGIAKWRKCIPHTFYMIKEQYQGKGIGTEFAVNNVSYARRHFKYIATIVDKPSVKAVKIAKRQGFKFIGEYDKKCYYIKSFGIIGSLVWLFSYPSFILYANWLETKRSFA
jgi:RimJ/RimL family protein N-acetyltransferase